MLDGISDAGTAGVVKQVLLRSLKRAEYAPNRWATMGWLPATTVTSLRPSAATPTSKFIECSS